MRRLALGLAVLGTVVSVTAVTASAAETTLPGGTTLSITIDPGVDGSQRDAGAAFAVTGTAAVGAAPAVKDTDLVFVIDRSGSTDDSAGVDCTGDAVADSVLTCEKAAVAELVAQARAARSPIHQVGIATFPTLPSLGLTEPGDPAIGAYLDALVDGSGGTNFSVGLDNARAVLAGSTAAERLVVLVTDGDGSTDAGEPPLDAVVLAYAVAGQGCGDPDLAEVVGLGLPGSACTVVASLDQLAGVIGETMGSQLTAVDVVLDPTVVAGEPAGGTPLAVQVTPLPPVDGPATVTFTAAVPGDLAPGPHVVCATAGGTDAVGGASVSDCATFDVVDDGTVVVDCSLTEGDEPCTATAADGDRSTLRFQAPPDFDEPVTIVPAGAAAGECGGADCRTGYDVLFPSLDPNGPVATITVVTVRRVTIREWARAAVYLDGTKIRRICLPAPKGRGWFRHAWWRDRVPCATIRLRRDGRLEYFVRFNADPAFRFR